MTLLHHQSFYTPRDYSDLLEENGDAPPKPLDTPEPREFPFEHDKIIPISGPVLSTLSDVSPIGGASKRIFDVTLSLIGLIMLSPILVIVWLSVRLTSNGPGIYRQSRGGFNGVSFVMYKFRSMRLDAHETKQAEMNDSRLTLIGNFLRRTSIDELPQLFNVLKGDMSLIGPRPHALAHDCWFESVDRRYRQRFIARPGITGWAQINGARGITETNQKIKRRVSLDLNYVRNWSLIRDMKILWLTAFMLLGFKANQNPKNPNQCADRPNSMANS